MIPIIHFSCWGSISGRDCTHKIVKSIKELNKNRSCQNLIIKLVLKKKRTITFVTIARIDSSRICNPRVAITDANTMIPCIFQYRYKLNLCILLVSQEKQKLGGLVPLAAFFFFQLGSNIDSDSSWHWQWTREWNLIRDPGENLELRQWLPVICLQQKHKLWPQKAPSWWCLICELPFFHSLQAAPFHPAANLKFAQIQNFFSWEFGSVKLTLNHSNDRMSNLG